MQKIQLYDTTLRDGAQSEGISFSVEDKLKIARKMDKLGIHYIEGGWPGSNPKDIDFFKTAKELSLSHAQIVAFGSTRHAKNNAENDPNIKAMLDAGTSTVCLVGKTSELHATQVLETTLEQNLRMIWDSIKYLKSKDYTVFFDAEHFFDGYKMNAEYSLKCVHMAAEAGADCVVLCDTNGGSLPQEIAAATAACQTFDVPLGIHAHNDGELAVANSLAAVSAGAVQVQGTINGYGERCGNANLCSIIPALKLKMGMSSISTKQLARLSDISHYVSEIANLIPNQYQPYVGASAFAHKAGLHVSGIMRNDASYQHMDPSQVGNASRVLVSELAGKSNIVYKAKNLGFDLSKENDYAKGVLDEIKRLENAGFQYDVAEASFEMLLRRSQEGYKAPFELVDFLVVVESQRRPPAAGNGGRMLSEAMVKVSVGNESIHTAAEGDGPVDALDAALRKALKTFYPKVADVKLIDYKVRILEESEGTGAPVRVLIESTDGEHFWRTVGSSTNLIEASWLSLVDSLEYWLVRKGKIRKTL
ncbi:MAG: citramalate synthase [Chloroflexi bacterium]|nr:citramalate synthase [Chloroflexota bacterium]MBT7082404.1 citramalate synthase [Chloroflexota bacterium]MBT7290644.1 citramalate synthase [Chloroflexota bacterium]